MYNKEQSESYYPWGAALAVLGSQVFSGELMEIYLPLEQKFHLYIQNSPKGWRGISDTQTKPEFFYTNSILF